MVGSRGWPTADVPDPYWNRIAMTDETLQTPDSQGDPENDTVLDSQLETLLSAEAAPGSPSDGPDVDANEFDALAKDVESGAPEATDSVADVTTGAAIASPDIPASVATKPIDAPAVAASHKMPGDQSESWSEVPDPDHVAEASSTIEEIDSILASAADAAIGDDFESAAKPDVELSVPCEELAATIAVANGPPAQEQPEKIVANEQPDSVADPSLTQRAIALLRCRVQGLPERIQRLCAWLNRPLNRLAPSKRTAVGYIGLVTVFNASILLIGKLIGVVLGY